MTTGPEMLDALKAATSPLPAGGCFVVNRMDVLILQKLTTADLTSRGFPERVARQVVADLNRGRLGLLARRLKLHLAESPIAPRLPGPRPSRGERERELRGLLQTDRGRKDIEGLSAGFRAPGSSPPDAARAVEEILAHEYPTAGGD
jgi:hypothetical protein